MVSEENFLRLTVPVSFHKNKHFKKMNFPMTALVNELTFLKLLVHISDNIAGVIVGLEYY